MSVRRRRKAIAKVVKLLNLATSANSSESTVALRHAESLIRLYGIAQRELPILKLCDRAMMYKVSWGGAPPRFAKVQETTQRSDQSVYKRRFSEKASPDTIYDGARTILDDWREEQGSPSANAMDGCEGDKVMSFQEDVELDEGDELDESVELRPTSNSDNVINATNAFRQSAAVAEEVFEQESSVSIDPACADDVALAEIKAQLAAYDEQAMLAKQEALKGVLHSSEQRLILKKKRRSAREQQELKERSERARIELSFEEAIEKAFQARAQAYEAWEKEQVEERLVCLKEEREALLAYEEISTDLARCQQSLNEHQQRKKDYQLAKVMHELRRHLALSVATPESYDAVIEILEANNLSLKNLEFSDIQNKSLFIRLLERETAKIEDSHEREQYTEAMLEKFLTARSPEIDERKAELPLDHIKRLLSAANKGGHFESHKNLEQVLHLMGAHDIGVRQIGYAHIKRYSVFISLVNWEAERIPSLPERESFTSQILEEYIQFSVQAPTKSADTK